jgi:hypothetical protein
MVAIINIQILLINNISIFNQRNNKILIKVTDPADTTIIIYEEIVLVKYELDEYLLHKNYFFNTNYYDLYPNGILTRDNFIINFVDETIIYNYNNFTRTIYIFYLNYFLPFNMLGIKNTEVSVSVKFTMNVNTTLFSIPDYEKICNVNNYTLQNQNRIDVLGNILSFNSPFIIQNTSNSLKLYNLYRLSTPFQLTKILKIFFYDTDFSNIQNIPYMGQEEFTTNAITILIQLYYSTEIKYQYLFNLNFDVINFNQYYYLVLYFKNKVNINYTNLSLRVFSYDFMTYFIETINTDYSGCEQITIDKSDLYSILIKNNNNIPSFTILNLNYDDYILNIDSIRVKEIIIFEIKNIEIVSNFLQSGNVEIKILIDYLYNFKMKDYNFINLRFSQPILENNQFIKVNFYNYQDFYKNDYVINFNDQQLNSILINIEISFYNKKKELQKYNIYGMLINNNNTWDIYTKQVILNEKNKYNLLKDFMLISANYFQVNIYSYNNIDDLNNNIKNPVLANTNMINPYYKFNLMIFSNKTCKLGFNLDENSFLKFTLTLIINYKILIFKVPKNTLDPILTFKNPNYYFKIYRINGINGNPYPNNDIYSIMFSSIDDCNYFMNYIEFGISVPPQKINSYFNIIPSKYFQKDSNGFYQIINSITPDNVTSGSGIIFFNIINCNLEENSTFLNNQIVVF